MSEDKPKLEQEINQGSMIPESDHRYYPRDGSEPWGLCGVCGLGEAAHEKSLVPYVPTAPRAVKSK